MDIGANVETALGGAGLVTFLGAMARTWYVRLMTERPTIASASAVAEQIKAMGGELLEVDAAMGAQAAELAIAKDAAVKSTIIFTANGELDNTAEGMRRERYGQPTQDSSGTDTTAATTAVASSATPKAARNGQPETNAMAKP